MDRNRIRQHRQHVIPASCVTLTMAIPVCCCLEDLLVDTHQVQKDITRLIGKLIAADTHTHTYTGSLCRNFVGFIQNLVYFFYSFTLHLFLYRFGLFVFVVWLIFRSLFTVLISIVSSISCNISELSHVCIECWLALSSSSPVCASYNYMSKFKDYIDTNAIFESLIYSKNVHSNCAKTCFRHLKARF